MLPIMELLLDAVGCASLTEGALRLAPGLCIEDDNERHRLALRAFCGQPLSPQETELIAQAVNLPFHTVNDACLRSVTQRQTWAELFVARGPHIYIETAGPVTQITFAALLHNRLKIHSVPATWRHLTPLLLLQRMMPLVRELAARTVSPLPIFGEVTGYTLYLAPDCAHQFDQRGNWLGGSTPVEYEGGKVSFSFETKSSVELTLV